MKKYLIVLLSILYIQSAFCQTASRAVAYYNPKWSPDGTSIVFESTMDGKSSIYTILPDGSGLRKITDTTFDYGQPSWSPDGMYLVYYGSVHPMQLFINASKGGEQRKLPTPGYDAYEPVWSLQNKLAFDSRAMGQTPNDIAVMNTDGTGFTKITVDEKYESSSPQWSPDGKKILYNRSIAIRKPWKEITKEEMERKKKTAEIMIMNPDGSGNQLLLSNLEGEVAPVWSRDGKTIYYLMKEDTVRNFYRMRLDQKKPERLASLTGIIYSVDVSPDENYITYVAERKKKHAVYIQDLKKKTEIKLIGD
ncbi:MAG TPA: hypothetical protein PLD84_15410 [Chitinophagales bacterium]|nr:hypothetical protein [Chitinophagales bacterium]